MQVWGQITEAGQVHFVRLQCLSQCALQRKHRVHEGLPVGPGEIGEFLYMLVPDDAAEPRIGGTIGTRHPHHAPLLAADNQLATITIAKLATGSWH